MWQCKATAGKASKYNIENDGTLECMVEGYIAVQVVAKMRRFRRVMAVQAKDGQCKTYRADRAASNIVEQ